jgi:hypothetical protein
MSHKRQRSLLEYSAEPPVLHTCPCCLGKTTRDPAEIVAEVEAGRRAKAEAEYARKFARDEKRRDKLRLLMDTCVQVPKQSARTGKWQGTEWIPKVMMETSWAIPRHVYGRIVSGFSFSKDHGFDVMQFKFQRVKSSLEYDPITMQTNRSDEVKWFTLWDLLASAFVPRYEVPLLKVKND